MQDFYFTYGLEGQPFKGGWTIVEAPDRESAVKVFRIFHPDRYEGIVNCADIYTEEQFQRTSMALTDNYGERLQETICLNRLVWGVENSVNSGENEAEQIPMF